VLEVVESVWGFNLIAEVSNFLLFEKKKKKMLN
jgi:hypothetical protein